MPTLIAGAFVVGTAVYLLFLGLDRDARRNGFPVDAFHTQCPRTVEEAHDAMQAHLECDKDRCPARLSAFLMLVREGHLVPTPQTLREYGVGIAR